MQPYYLYTFESTHGAIASHKLLKDSLNAVIMPVLREINASCGMAVKVMPEDYDKSLQLMTSNMGSDFSLYFVDGKTITQLINENK
ncbi:MAG: DUF3343 domain-containing protein [Clostridiaceae bacterium]|nr:DUF3343 domain-containing protein [Clostridiaceae bacterium]